MPGRDLIEQGAKRADRGAGGTRERRQALLVALAAHGDERGLGCGDRLLETQGFRHAQARPVDEFDETSDARRVQPLAQRPLRDVESLARGRDQALDLGHAQKLRQRSRSARALDRQRRVVAPPTFGVQEFVKLTDRRQTARQRRRAQLLRAAGREKPAHMSCVRLQRVDPLGLQIGFVVGEIAPIGVDRVHARAALRGERLEEADDVRNRPRLHTVGQATPPPRTEWAVIPRAAARRGRDGGRRATSRGARAACAARSQAG